MEVARFEGIRCENYGDFGKDHYGTGESRDAAEEQVKNAYYNSEYILDAENFTGVKFGTQEEREIQQ